MFDILLSQGPIVFLVVLACLIAALSIHEFAHALAADKLGDPTPRLQGRLTLNPLAHLDPLGTILLVFIGFGWGKPVMFDPYNLKNPRRDAAFISLAGPVSNLSLALLAAIILRILFATVGPFTIFTSILQLIVYFNLLLALFNLIPIHPLDGGKIFIGFLPENEAEDAEKFLRRYGTLLLIFLIFPLVNGQSPVFMVISPVIDFLMRILLPSATVI